MDRWQKGESLGSIARLFGRYNRSIEDIIARSGGIRPSPRHRSSLSLSLAERKEILHDIANAQSLRSIAASLSRSSSTISREIKRNSGLKNYRARETDQSAWGSCTSP